MSFQYNYNHLNCAYCLDLSAAASCPHQICHHIMDNLDDLTQDPAFHAAVAGARACGTFHRATLLQLQGMRLSCPA